MRRQTRVALAHRAPRNDRDSMLHNERYLVNYNQVCVIDGSSNVEV